MLPTKPVMARSILPGTLLVFHPKRWYRLIISAALNPVMETPEAAPRGKLPIPSPSLGICMKLTSYPLT